MDSRLLIQKDGNRTARGQVALACTGESSVPLGGVAVNRRIATLGAPRKRSKLGSWCSYSPQNAATSTNGSRTTFVIRARRCPGHADRERSAARHR